MITIACTKCLVSKPPVDFYAHPNGAHGKMSKCKECHKAGVRTNRAANRERYSAFDRARTQTPERKASSSKHQKARRARCPEKFKARSAVSNALRDRRLKRGACEVCGSLRVQAHHADYSKPLDVRWLCFKCHREEEHGQVVTVNDDGRTKHTADPPPF